jgi:hypothetical protein
MNSRPGITLILAAACASDAIGLEKANIPAHTHQESKAPQGPNAYDLSFARNGARTDTVHTMTIPAKYRL